MEKCFHSNVDKNFVEYFLQDLYINLQTLICMTRELNKELPVKKRKKLMKQIINLKDFINEELSMFERLQDERPLTSAEIKLYKQIKKLRDSEDIKKLEALSR